MNANGDLSTGNRVFTAHDWCEGAVEDAFQCSRCRIYIVGTANPDGWCELPELLARWSVDGAIGTVSTLDFGDFTFALAGSSTRHKFGAGRRAEPQ